MLNHEHVTARAEVRLAVTRTQVFAALLCIALLGWCVSSGWSLTDSDIAQLVLLEWHTVADIAVSKVQWLGDGETIAFGGRQVENDRRVVGLYPDAQGETKLLPNAASEQFGVAPDGRRIAYWRLVPMEQGHAAELTVYDPSGPLMATVGAPRSCNPAMHLAWLSDRHILFTFQRDPGDSGSLFVADIEGGGPLSVAQLEGGRWLGLRVAPGPTAIAEFATATGLQREHVYLDSSGQTRTSSLADLPASDAPPFELDANGRLILLQSSTEGVIADENVSSVSLSQDGRTALYTKAQQLLAMSADDGQARTLNTSHESGFVLQGCSWSPAASHVCGWARRNDGGRLWYGLLGLERITARFEFSAGSAVAVDNRLWVVGRFQLDAQGRIIEPDWTTLKALFVVRRVLRGTDKVIADAESIGRQAGVVTRMTGSERPPPLEDADSHIRIGIGEEPTTQWAHAFRARPLPALLAWLERTSEAGRPLVINVERQVLLPLGPQQQ